MPLVGLRDNNGAAVDFADVARGKGVFDDPPNILMALYQERTPYCDYSITELKDDAYKLELGRRIDYYETPDEQMDRIIGSSIHALIESNTTGMVEYRMSTEVSGDDYEGVLVGGTTDRVLVPHIWDYKSTSAAKLRVLLSGRRGAHEDYVWQLGGYRWLLSIDSPQIAKKITGGKIRLFVRDWRFSEFRDKFKCSLVQYPKGGLLTLDLPTPAQMKPRIRDAVKRHVSAARLVDKKLHTAGECDTWDDYLRCRYYCPLKEQCHFRKDGKADGKQMPRRHHNRR